MAEGDFNIRAIISADSSKFDRGMKNVGNSVKNTSNQIDGLTSKMKTAFTALGGLFAINKIKNFSSESVKVWKYQEKQLKILSQTLKVTGASAWTSSKEIQNFASSLQKVTNYGDEAIISMQNVLLGFKNIQGDTFKEATKAILDMSTVMNMDLTSACQAVGKALDDPIQGIGALSRQGFRFSDEQKKLIKSLIDTGKTAEAQKIILDELKTTYGGASEASADIGEQLQNTWNDLKERIGGAIAEITNKFLGFLKNVVEGIQNMSAHTKTFISAFAKTALALGGLTTAVYVFKTALDALKAHPIILAISLAISGISALIGLFSSANQELEDEAEDLRRINEASKALFSTSDKEKKLTAQQVKELTRLYPELTGKIKADNTTVAKAIELQKELHKQKTLNLFSKQKEELDKLTDTYNELQKEMKQYKKDFDANFGDVRLKRENLGAYNKRISEFNYQLKQANQDIEASIVSINASLESIGKKYDRKTGKLIDVEIKVDVDENSLNTAENTIKSNAKSWKEYLSKALDVKEIKFEDGAQAVEIYKNRLIESMKEGEEIAKSLGIPFSKTEYLESRLNEIHDKIIELLGVDPDEIDEPFELEQLEKENSALANLVKLYKELQLQRTDSEIQDLKKSVDELAMSEDELYLSTLRNKGATEEQIAQARKLLQQKKIQASMEEQWVRDRDIIDNYDAKLLDKKIEQEEKWTQEYENLTAQKIEKEREFELSNAKSSEARAKINEYYDNEIAKNHEKCLEERKKHEEDLRKKMIKNIKAIGTAFINTFKNITSTSKRVVKTVIDSFKTIADGVKGIFESVTSLFDKLFTFDMDESLNSILEYEDKILTFFFEGLEKLPDYFNAIFNSFENLLDTLLNGLDFDAIEETLDEFINSISKNITKLIPKLSTFIKKVFKTISNLIIKNAGVIIKTIGDLIMELVRMLPTIIPQLISMIGSIISALADYIINNGDEFAEMLSQTINNVIQQFSAFIKNGGWKTLLQAILKIQKMLEKVVTDNIEDIANAIMDALPELVDTLVESVVSASETLKKIAKPIIKVILAIIKAIIDLIGDERVMNAFVETTEELTKAFVEALAEMLPGIISSIINLLTNAGDLLPRLIIAIVNGLVKGLWNALTSKSTWTGLGDAFYKIFKSLLNGVGRGWEFIKDFVKGIGNGLIWGKNKIKSGFSNVVSWIKDAFSGIGNWFYNIFSDAWSGIKSAWSGVKGWFSDLASDIGDMFSDLGDTLSDFFEDVGDWISGRSTSARWTKGILTGGISEIFGFADGTQSAPRGLAMVGEEGPELVKFRGGEQVINSHNTQKALSNMGNNNNTFNVTFNNTKDTSAFALVQQLKQYNRQMAINGII